MAFAIDTYTATAAQTDFTITFPYVTDGHVVVTLDGAAQTEGAGNDYTLPNATTVRFTAGLTVGQIVVLTRKTSRTARLVDYTAGALSEADLDNDSTQSFYMAQEAMDKADATKDLEFVSTTALTAAATAVVTTIAAGYDYMISLEEFAPTDDAESLWLRFSDDAGVTYEAGASDYEWGLVVGGGYTGDTADAQIDLTNEVGNDGTNINTIELTLVSPGGVLTKTTCHWRGFLMNEDATPLLVPVIGAASFLQGTDAVDAVQFLWSGGSTFKAQGQVTVWRRKRS